MTERTACSLCRSSAVLIHDDGRRRFFHCPECDLIAVPPPWHLDAESQKESYLKHQNTADDDGYIESLRKPLGLLQQYGRGVRRVLDYGSGPAPVLVELWNCTEGRGSTMV